MATQKPLIHEEQVHGDVSGAQHAKQRKMHPLIFRISRVVNPFLLGNAGGRRLMKVAVIHHQGRHSGHSYATPTSARPTPDGFIVPMTFGDQADWFRNIQAAGGCIIEWEGTHYQMVEPEAIDLATARSAFSPLERVFIPFLGVMQFVRLRHAPK